MKSKKDPAAKGKKLVLFKALAILTPVTFLFFLEVLLRLFNYGNNTDLFIKYPLDNHYLVMNYYASDKFFPDTVSATKGNQEIFKIDKTPDTFRIFVLGESTTIGYPFRPNGSFHRWLQYRLMHMYPGKNFEVINLSLTAVNSYTVLDFGSQLAKYQPDAVLIYTGHNEYYGALGIGSTTYLGSNRFLVQTLIWLREFRCVQLFNNFIQKVSGIFASKKAGDQKSLMEVMAARQHIAYNSSDYKTGIKQFDKNMTELCSTLNDKKIPTFLSIVVSNEKDQPPFISNGKGAGSAAWFYNEGQLALKRMSYDTAKLYFDKARELDELRFRAPEAINNGIKKIAAEFPNVHLVDAKKMFEQYSPHGIVGNETIMEHLHPNLFGYAILSDAFYQAIKKQQLIKDKPDRDITFDELRKEMPITKMDSLLGAYQIMMLKTGWPFNQPIDKQFKVDQSLEGTLAVKIALGQRPWDNAMGELFRSYKKTNDKQAEAKIAEAMVLQYPYREDFYGFAGNLNIDLKNYTKAAFYYKKLYILNKDSYLPEAIFKLYLNADDPMRALPYIKYSSPMDPQQAKVILLQIIEDETLLKEKPDDKSIRQRIRERYRQLGVKEAVQKYLNNR